MKKFPQVHSRHEIRLSTPFTQALVRTQHQYSFKNVSSAVFWTLQWIFLFRWTFGINLSTEGQWMWRFQKVTLYCTVMEPLDFIHSLTTGDRRELKCLGKKPAHIEAVLYVLPSDSDASDAVFRLMQTTTGSFIILRLANSKTLSLIVLQSLTQGSCSFKSIEVKFSSNVSQTHLAVIYKWTQRPWLADSGKFD